MIVVFSVWTTHRVVGWMNDGGCKLAVVSREQSAALTSLRSRAVPSTNPTVPDSSAPPDAVNAATVPVPPVSDDQTTKVADATGGRTPRTRNQSQESASLAVLFDDVADEGADTTQISLRLPRAHLRALRQWAAQQTVTRSDARTVTAQQIILKLIEGAVRQRENSRG